MQKQEKLKPCTPDERKLLAENHAVERVNMRKALVRESSKDRPPGSSYVGIDPSGVLFRKKVNGASTSAPGHTASPKVDERPLLWARK